MPHYIARENGPNKYNIALSALLRAKELLADRGDDSGCFRAALTERGITLCY